jgi:hypothetical protein
MELSGICQAIKRSPKVFRHMTMPMATHFLRGYYRMVDKHSQASV